MTGACTRCGKREPASERHELCGACRFYTRGRYETEHMQQVSVRLPQALIDALHATAEREGRTLSDVIREALRSQDHERVCSDSVADRRMVAP